MKKEISLFKDLKIYNWKENKNLPCRDGCRLYGCSLFLPHVFDHVLALNLNLFFYLFTFSFIWFRISLLNFAQSFSHTPLMSFNFLAPALLNGEIITFFIWLVNLYTWTFISVVYHHSSIYFNINKRIPKEKSALVILDFSNPLAARRRDASKEVEEGTTRLPSNSHWQSCVLVFPPVLFHGGIRDSFHRRRRLSHPPLRAALQRSSSSVGAQKRTMYREQSARWPSFPLILGWKLNSCRQCVTVNCAFSSEQSSNYHLRSRWMDPFVKAVFKN